MCAEFGFPHARPLCTAMSTQYYCTITGGTCSCFLIPSRIIFLGFQTRITNSGLSFCFERDFPRQDPRTCSSLLSGGDSPRAERGVAGEFRKRIGNLAKPMARRVEHRVWMRLNCDVCVRAWLWLDEHPPLRPTEPQLL